MKKIVFVMPNKGFSGAEKVVIQIINGIKDVYDCYYMSQSGMINLYLKENNINHIITEKKLDRSELKRILNNLKPDIVVATDYRASVVINSVTFAISSVKFDKIFIVSESIEKEFIFNKCMKKKFCLVSNPLCREDILRQDINNYKKIYDISFIGRFCEQKDPEKFIKIVKQIKEKGIEIHSLMMGDGSWKNRVEEWIKCYNVENNIELRNFEKNPYPYFKKSKIIVMPSKFEGFGLVAYESMCFGIPVVACPVRRIGKYC